MLDPITVSQAELTAAFELLAHTFTAVGIVMGIFIGWHVPMYAAALVGLWQWLCKRSQWLARVDASLRARYRSHRFRKDRALLRKLARVHARSRHA